MWEENPELLTALRAFFFFFFGDWLLTSVRTTSLVKTKQDTLNTLNNPQTRQSLLAQKANENLFASCVSWEI